MAARPLPAVQYTISGALRGLREVDVKLKAGIWYRLDATGHFEEIL